MALRSGPDRYGTVALWLHWLTVLVILLMIATGLAMERTEDEAVRLQLLRGHALWGTVVLTLTTLRLLWRLADRKPPQAAGVPGVQRVAARAVHVGFYLVLLFLVLTGAATLLVSGALDTVLGRASTPLPEDFLAFAARHAHGIGVRVFVALLAVHVLAALYHHWIRRDDVLRSMLPASWQRGRGDRAAGSG
jgi:cytochrome b561